MTKTFADIIDGIRKAVLGVEVREDIAQGMEYVERFAATATQKAEEAASSAEKAAQAKQETEDAKDTAVSAINTAKSEATDEINTEKSGALSAIGEKKAESLQELSKKQGEALDEISRSVSTAQDAAGTAVREATAAAGSASNAAESEKNAKASATAAQEHQTRAEAAQKKAEDAADRAAATVSTDKTLTVENAPADAKAVGEALKNLNIRPATSTTLGGIKVGSGLTVDADGTLSADSALAAYPVGSIYQSTDPTSPAQLFGGTWEQIAQDRVLMGASDSHPAGSTVEAGLPNITGSLTSTATSGGSGPFRGTSNSVTSRGALSTTAISATYAGYSKYGGTEYSVHFDASASNSIYGASNTVQPPAYFVWIWRRIS